MAVPLKGGSSRTLWHLGETVVGETLGNAAVGFGYDTRPSGQPPCSRRSRHREGALTGSLAGFKQIRKSHESDRSFRHRSTHIVRSGHE